jgi:hypothetical protein
MALPFAESIASDSLLYLLVGRNKQLKTNLTMPQYGKDFHL